MTKSSSSASSSTSSSIDEALIQFTQKQQKFSPMKNVFNPDSMPFFPYNSLTTSTTESEEQQAVQENLQFLASMASASTPVTPESPWSQTSSSSALDPTANLARKISSSAQQRKSGSTSSMKSSNTLLAEFLTNLNELCYKGFDELNALTQEQKWVCQWRFSSSSHDPSSPSSGPKLRQFEFNFASITHFTDFNIEWFERRFIPCFDRSGIFYLQMQKDGDHGSID